MNRKKLLIFLVDEAHTYEYGIRNEFEASEAKVMTFSTFEECSRSLHKSPDVVVMDDIADDFEKSRIKARFDQLPVSVKLIFIATPGVKKEAIKPLVIHDDYVVKDASLFEKVHLAVDEYAFSNTYNENYDGETIEVAGSSIEFHDLLLPASVMAVAFAIFILAL